MLCRYLFSEANQEASDRFNGRKNMASFKKTTVKHEMNMLVSSYAYFAHEARPLGHPDMDAAQMVNCICSGITCSVRRMRRRDI